jgi:hypothetical protein
MIALENMTQVNSDVEKFVPVANWNWTPDVRDPKKIEKTNLEASGGRTTTKQTFSNQQDHGESD